jgi:hypothetical protein
MRACPYCGRDNEWAATHCCECGTEFEGEGDSDDSQFADPRDALVTLAEFPNLAQAALLKEDLEAAGIEACIPEELAPNAFGHFSSPAHITVQVAAKDLDAARLILASRPE